METQEYVSPLEYAASRGVCQATVYRWMKLGMPHTAKPQCSIRRKSVRLIDPVQADKWVEQRAAGKEAVR